MDRRTLKTIETRAEALARIARTASGLCERVQATVVRNRETIHELEARLTTARASLLEAETMLPKIIETLRIANEAAEAALENPSPITVN